MNGLLVACWCLMAVAGIVDDPHASWNRYGDKELKGRAASAMQARISPVTEKKALADSGDPHDYLSMGPYWWPNPATSNGLPYVRRDGEFNTAGDSDSDRRRLDRMLRSVMDLAAAARRLGDHEAGREAARRLRVFFLDPATRMNPNLNYAQAIPGRCTGRGTGIIDTLVLARFVVDSILVLKESGDLPEEDFDGLKKWFGDYLEWLLTSKNGKEEGEARNNHGSNYDLQCVVYALFVGREELARKILRDVPSRRIDRQIEPDGRQPLELARTKAFSYSTYNLMMLCTLAVVAERQGIDLWGYESGDGRSIRRALSFLEPYWKDPKSWPYKQIAPVGKDPGAVPLAIKRHFEERQ